MLKYGNKEFRNLEEQVRQNKDDIARHYAQDRVLADFGIKIVGQVDTVEELPDPASYEGKYGDAYAVGSAAPFTYYIWTRANNISPTDYWFDFGEITIAGPQGPKGDSIKGDPGTPGNKWYVGTNYPSTGTYNVGDMYLNPQTGEVKRYQKAGGDNYTWITIGNIKGQTGAPGPRGENAGSIQIAAVRGKVPTVEVLTTIDPDTVPVGTAYLVGEALPYEVYLPINGMWENIGQFDAGTIAMEGGSPLSVVNMDNYLNAEGSNLGDWDDEWEELYGNYGVIPVMRGDNFVYDFVIASKGNGEDQDYLEPYVIPMTDDDGLIHGSSWEAQNYAVDDNGFVGFVPTFGFLMERFSAMAVPVQVDIECDLGQEGSFNLHINRVAAARSIGAYFENGEGQYQFSTFRELADRLYGVDNGALNRQDLVVSGTVYNTQRGDNIAFTMKFEPNPHSVNAYQIKLHTLHPAGQTEYITLSDQGLEWGNLTLRSTNTFYVDY